MKAFKILSFVMAALLAVPSLWAGALTLQSAEDAKEIIAAAPAASLAVSESDKSCATTAEEAAKEFPEYDPDFGQRIYFNNFHDEPQSLVGAFVFDAGAASAVDGIPVVAGSGAGFINTAYYGIGVHADGDTFVYDDGTPVTGVLFLRATVKAVNDMSLRHMWGMNMGDAWGAYHTYWHSSPVTAGVWTDVATYQTNVKAASCSGLDFRATAGSKTFYVSRIALYVQQPDNEFWLTDENGEGREFVRVTDTTYTFPTSFGGKAVALWTDGTNTYKGGQTVSKGALWNKTFRVYQYLDHPTYGSLLYFEDFEDGKANPGYYFPQGAYNAYMYANAGQTYTVLDTDPADGSTARKCVEVTGASYSLFEVLGCHPVGTMYRTLTVMADVYAASDASLHTYLRDANWAWNVISVKGGKWNTDVKYSYKNVTVGNTTLQCGLYGKYLDNIRVYALPASVDFVSADGSETETVALTASFTFPSALGEKAVALWTDGENTYFAGETVENKFALDGKTFTELPLAPETAKTAEYRSNGTAGIRFKADVTFAARAKADSYGFLITRKAFLADANGDDLTFDLTREGGKTAYAVGECYAKDAENNVTVDKQYALNDDSVTFAGVATGIPAGAEDEVMVARSYLKYGESTFYGESVKASVNSARNGASAD